jgi:flavin reductase (DIM6/NTAB) family NADH-FMN oxidoreductase RutF
MDQKRFLWSEKGKLQGGDKLSVPYILNTILGPRPVVLVGTRATSGTDNLAIFNTLQPVGARPPLFTLLVRPLDRQRDSYENMKETREWSVNFFRPKSIQKAHATREHFPNTVSEFDAVGLEREKKEGIHSPFLASAPVQMWFQWGREIDFPENGTRLVLGHLRKLWLSKEIQLTGSPDFTSFPIVSSWGLSHYVNGAQVTTGKLK